MIDLSKYIIHDLSHSLDDKIAGFASKVSRTIENDGWNAKELSIYSHAGTHMDAPLHFGITNQSIDQYSPEDLLSIAWVVDVHVNQSKQLIELDDVVSQLEDMKDGESILIRTNWSKFFERPNFKSDLPRIGEDLARWMVRRKVKLVGVEPLSVADVENLEEVTKIHTILLGGQVIIVEGLKNLDRISNRRVLLIALPLKVVGGDGAPARVIALEDRGYE